VTNAVLYIEDDPDNITLVARMLTRRPNLRLLSATNAHDGLELAQSTSPGLILLDRRLPDMLGSEVLRRLKASTLTAAIPVIVLSGDSGRHHTDELRELGAAEFLAKPFDIHQLMTLIDRYCA
jgi:two-component system, sensor histidine kinase and response regulator